MRFAVAAVAAILWFPGVARASTSNRGTGHEPTWRPVAVVGNVRELADFLSRRELPVDDLELAEIAARSIDFLRDNPGAIGFIWHPEERRLTLVSSEGRNSSVPLQDSRRAGESRDSRPTVSRMPSFAGVAARNVTVLGERLGKATGPDAAQSVLLEYFDQAAAKAAGAIPATDARIGGGSLAAAELKTATAGDPGVKSEPPSPHFTRAFAPHFVTGLNLASGLGALLYAAHGAVLPAAGLILLANAFDALDGRVARWLGVAGPMGTELDSLADVISFGAAPALLIHQAALTTLGWPGAALAAAFAFSGAYRLARFNLQALSPKKTRNTSDSFTGMPIPAGAGVIVSLALALPWFSAAATPWIAAAVTAVAALAMVSTVPYPAFKKGGIKGLALPASLSIASALFLLWIGLPALIPAAVFGGYLFSGPLRAVTKRYSSSSS